jgi:hypothetical protein
VLNHFDGGPVGGERGAPRHLNPPLDQGRNSFGLRQICPHKHYASIDGRRAEANFHVATGPVTKTLYLNAAGEGSLCTKLLSQGKLVKRELKPGMSESNLLGTYFKGTGEKSHPCRVDRLSHASA